MPDSSLERRFWAKVDMAGPLVRPELGRCWVWTASTHRQGYGSMLAHGSAKLAHRVSWELAYGEQPLACVCHRCDNVACVRPAHLFLGTQGDNIRDMVSKGRQRGRGLPGEGNGNAKLTAQAVREIRKAHASGLTHLRTLSQMFGVGPSAISAIVLRQKWAHVE